MQTIDYWLELVYIMRLERVFVESFFIFGYFLFFTSASVLSLTMLIKPYTKTSEFLVNTLVFIVSTASSIICLGLDFLGLIYIIVYAGAILIMFLSVLMVISQRAEELNQAASNINVNETTKLNNWLEDIMGYNFFFIYIFFANFTWFSNLLTWNYFKEDTENHISPELVLDILTYYSNPLKYISKIMYGPEKLLIFFIGLIFLLVMISAVSFVLSVPHPDITWENAWSTENNSKFINENKKQEENTINKKIYVSDIVTIFDITNDVFLKEDFPIWNYEVYFDKDRIVKDKFFDKTNLNRKPFIISSDEHFFNESYETLDYLGDEWWWL